MSKFVDSIFFETETCCDCGMAFAMTTEFRERMLKTKKPFYCPAGHQQYYCGKTAAQKEKERLQRELNSANERADRFREQAVEQQGRATAISRSYKKVRERIKNGVCPCCNRTFSNLAKHMQTKHPDYAENAQLRVLRVAYGLTQAQIGKEIGVSASYISLFERGVELPKRSEQRITDWIQEQRA